MNRNPDVFNMIASRKQDAEDCYRKVLETIDLFKKEGRKITTVGICKAAGVSNNYFSNHKELYPILNDAKNHHANIKKSIQNDSSKDALIISLKAENRLLKNKIKDLEKDEKYRSRYEAEITKNAELKKQLNAVYNQKLDMNF